MMLIGIDPHKSTHTATAVDPGHQPRRLPRSGSTRRLREYRRMLTWARQWPQRRWAVENAEGLGRHLTSWLLARGEDVVDVPTTATARVRQLSRGGGRKNDRIDAGAAACVAALQGDARPLQAEGSRRRPGGARRATGQPGAVPSPRRQPAPRAAAGPHRRRRTSGSVRCHRSRAAAHGPPQGAVEQARKAVAKDLVAEIRSLDTQLKAERPGYRRLVAAAGSTLTDTSSGSGRSWPAG